MAVLAALKRERQQPQPFHIIFILHCGEDVQPIVTNIEGKRVLHRITCEFDQLPTVAYSASMYGRRSYENYGKAVR